MKVNVDGRSINTTLGELIAAISEVAFETSANAKEAYTLTGLVLMELLKSASFKSEIPDQPMRRFLH